MRFFGARRAALVVCTALTLAGSAVYASQLQRIDAVEVRLGGRPVALVQSQAVVGDVLSRLRAEAEARAGVPLALVDEPQLVAVRVPRSQPLAGADELAAALRPLLRYEARAAVIRVDGRDAVAVRSRQEAQGVLARILARHRAQIEAERTPGAQGERVEVREVRFLERVEVVEAAVDPARVRPQEAAEGVLLRGTDEVREHVVGPGETLWSIARGAGISVRDLIRANPGLSDPDRLQVGQRLSLVVPRPWVTVRSVEVRTFTVPIPFATRIRQDGSLWPWQRRVERAGVPGSKQVVEEVVRENGRVVRRTVVGERVLKPPQEQVVVQGTRAAPAVGTGVLGWPLDLGRISSWFGWRGRRDFHEGVDIAAPPGTPVRAADAGTVVLAGWYGAYGRTVLIDHGGGRRVTLYGHLARISVREGQRVAKGQVIGTVGCSGRCTGPHLHFEVRIGGRAVNPMQFFR